VPEEWEVVEVEVVMVVMMMMVVMMVVMMMMMMMVVMVMVVVGIDVTDLTRSWKRNWEMNWAQDEAHKPSVSTMMRSKYQAAGSPPIPPSPPHCKYTEFVISPFKSKKLTRNGKMSCQLQWYRK